MRTGNIQRTHRRSAVTATRVSVLLAASPAFSLARTQTSLRWKRAAIWRNRSRNELIAAIGLAVRDGKPARLRRLGLRLDDTEFPRRGATVTILTESTEHARELLALLPDWEMHDEAPVEYPEGYEPDPDTTEPANGNIVTLMHAVHNGLRGDVIVRATGGRGQISVGQTRSGRTLLIDFDDCTDARSVADATERFRAYLDNEWPVVRPAAPED